MECEGGNEDEYESLPSEDSYELASDRGRDEVKRIISASHCVDVFRRLGQVDGGVYCCHSSKPTKTKVVDCPVDPLEGLPPRILRFDGAMEAWLEEAPLQCRRSSNARLRVSCVYRSLNDAAAVRPDLSLLKAGNEQATVWYFTVEFLSQLWPLFLRPVSDQDETSGIRIWARFLLERGANIQSTHVNLGQVHCPAQKGKARTAWLKALFSTLQATKWAADGEAQTLLVSKRLSHISMSIGDAVSIGGELYVAGLTGFVLMDGSALIPPDEGESRLTLERWPGDEVYDNCSSWSFGSSVRSSTLDSSSCSTGGEHVPKQNGKAHASGKTEESNNTNNDVKGDGGDDDAARKKYGRGGKNKGKGKGAPHGGGEGGKNVEGDAGKGGKGKKRKGKGKGKGNGKDNGKSAAKDAVGGRADRRELRAQLQATRAQQRAN